ncbi:MAG: GDP-mannose-dependent alpha-mannosyltransferase [Parcubacteria group bacterium ADurb.Bin159]|jgi:glycosyltransferase involved in cell wall biosynthesis|nr:MAG: GDP-mannose-dependent alpha-mannosyltransferase [Parcubacteria group bacterium ADurb.Bin159]
MKVAIIHDYLNQYGGAEKVLEAMHEIWPEAPIFTLFYDPKKMPPHFQKWDIRVSPISNLPFGTSHYRVYLPLMPAAIERFNLSDYDLVISSSSAYAKGVLIHKGCLHFCYCHTPTRYLWSDTFDYIENLSGFEKYFKKILPVLLTYLRIWDENASKRPDYFIANSRFVGERIKKYYHRESEVIYPPVEIDKFYISPKIENYFLLVSRFRPYKKIDLAINVFNELGIPLKIIGTGNDKYLKKIAGPNIEFLGNLTDEEKAKYFSKAQALIHPQEEDFGITPLEAMASGRPVIAYRAGGALETIVEGLTGEFFYPQTKKALAKVVSSFEVKKYDPQKIRDYAQKFSKERFKGELINFINKRIKK